MNPDNSAAWLKAVRTVTGARAARSPSDSDRETAKPLR